MLLDVGIGIFAAILVGKAFTLELGPLLVGFGIAFALLPDFDLWYILLRDGNRDHRAIARHRDLGHYPLLYIPVGTLLAAVFGAPWALLFALGAVGHFVHDSIGTGWGVPWFWPFTNRNYTFFYRYTPVAKPLPKQMLYRWEHERLDEVTDEYWDPQFFKNVYGKLHPLFLAEIAVFVVALLALWRAGHAGS